MSTRWKSQGLFFSAAFLRGSVARWRLRQASACPDADLVVGSMWQAKFAGMCGFGVVHHGRINSAPLVLNPFDWPWAEQLFHSCGLERFFCCFRPAKEQQILAASTGCWSQVLTIWHGRVKQLNLKTHAPSIWKVPGKVGPASSHCAVVCD